MNDVPLQQVKLLLDAGDRIADYLIRLNTEEVEALFEGGPGECLADASAAAVRDWQERAHAMRLIYRL